MPLTDRVVRWVVPDAAFQPTLAERIALGKDYIRVLLLGVDWWNEEALRRLDRLQALVRTGPRRG